MDLHNLTALHLISAGAIVGSTAGLFTYGTFNLIEFWRQRQAARKAAPATRTTPENLWEKWRADLDKVALGRTIQPVTAENDSIRLVYVPSTGGTSLRIFSGPLRFTAWAAPDDLQVLAAPLYPVLYENLIKQVDANRSNLKNLPPAPHVLAAMELAQRDVNAYLAMREANSLTEARRKYDATKGILPDGRRIGMIEIK